MHFLFRIPQLTKRTLSLHSKGAEGLRCFAEPIHSANTSDISITGLHPTPTVTVGCFLCLSLFLSFLMRSLAETANDASMMGIGTWSVSKKVHARSRPAVVPSIMQYTCHLHSQDNLSHPSATNISALRAGFSNCFAATGCLLFDLGAAFLIFSFPMSQLLPTLTPKDRHSRRISHY